MEPSFAPRLEAEAKVVHQFLPDCPPESYDKILAFRLRWSDGWRKTGCLVPENGIEYCILWTWWDFMVILWWFYGDLMAI